MKNAKTPRKNHELHGDEQLNELKHELPLDDDDECCCVTITMGIIMRMMNAAAVTITITSTMMNVVTMMIVVADAAMSIITSMKTEKSILTKRW